MSVLLLPFLFAMLGSVLPGLSAWRAATRTFAPPPALYLMGTTVGLAAFAFTFSIPFMLYSEKVVAVIELGLTFVASGAFLAGLAYGLKVLGETHRDPLIQLASTGCFFAVAAMPVAWFVLGGWMATLFAITWS